MNRVPLGSILLWVALALMAGWAFLKMTEPANMLEFLRLFSFC